MVKFLLKLLLKHGFLAVHHDFHWFSQISFAFCYGVGNFAKVGVGYFTSDSATLLFTADIGCFMYKILQENYYRPFECKIAHFSLSDSGPHARRPSPLPTVICNLNGSSSKLFNFNTYRPLIETNHILLDALHSVRSCGVRHAGEVNYEWRGYLTAEDRQQIKTSQQWKYKQFMLLMAVCKDCCVDVMLAFFGCIDRCVFKSVHCCEKLAADHCDARRSWTSKHVFIGKRTHVNKKTYHIEKITEVQSVGTSKVVPGGSLYDGEIFFKF